MNKDTFVKNFKIEKGDVFYVELGEIDENDSIILHKTRPCIIYQSNESLHPRSKIFSVIPILSLKEYDNKSDCNEYVDFDISIGDNIYSKSAVINQLQPAKFYSILRYAYTISDHIMEKIDIKVKKFYGIDNNSNILKENRDLKEQLSSFNYLENFINDNFGSISQFIDSVNNSKIMNDTKDRKPHNNYDWNLEFCKEIIEASKELSKKEVMEMFNIKRGSITYVINKANKILNEEFNN